VQQNLQAWGIAVTTAEDGMRALDILHGAVAAAAPFELVLLDRHMPVMDGLELAQRIRADAELRRLRLIMLSSRDIDDVGPNAARLFNERLTKPVRQTQLFAAIVRAMSNDGQSSSENIVALAAAPDVPLQSLQARVLLVEDNPVNREVAVGMLESLGCKVSIAENGWLAIEAMNDPTFDAVLMDCQMPVMDGLTASAEIRRRETAQGRGRIPIIALTANAMEGDRERCIAADDFLSKPFSTRDLGDRLRRWLAPHDRNQPAEFQVTVEADADLDRVPIIDVGVLRNIDALGKPKLVDTMIELYLQHSLELLRAVEVAAANGAVGALRDAAHSLKSSTANLGGTRLAAVCKECETQAREQHLAAAAALTPRIRREYQEFRSALVRERASNAA
jgi:two-component system, sensor histidine kinase and response regulator